MAKFLVSIKSISYYSVEVEADSRDDARDFFDYKKVDFSNPDDIETDIFEVEQVE